MIAGKSEMKIFVVDNFVPNQPKCLIRLRSFREDRVRKIGIVVKDR